MWNWGLDVNNVTRLTGGTPLLVAVKPKELNEVIRKMVLVLLECGACNSLNIADKAGDTPLLLAVLAGYPKVVDQLLLAGADPFKTDVDGNTILHLATQVNAVEVCKLIMQKYPDFVRAENNDGKTPYHIAAMHDRACLEELFCIHESECFSKPDKDGYSSLDIAAKAGQKATFKILWDKMDQHSPPQVEVERNNLKFFIKRVEEEPFRWEMLAGYLQTFPKMM